MSLDDKLLNIALNYQLHATEVVLKYEQILDYVKTNYPRHTDKVYEEIALIRTQNWCRSLSKERMFDPKKGYENGGIK